MNDTNENSNRECEAIGNTSTKNEPQPSNDTTKKKLVGIYGLRCKSTNKWYVGQSVDIYDRWSGYRILDCKKQPKLYNSLLKYGYDGFEAVIIEKCEEIPWIMDYREMYWIRHLDCVNNGYNCTEGGLGGRKSEETKKKMSKSRMGIVYSEETRRRMSMGQKTPKQLAFVKSLAERRRGKALTDEHKVKIGKNQFGESNHFYGKSHSDAVKMVISKKAKDRNIVGYNNPFFGKTHSEETKRKISEKAKERARLKKLRIEPEMAVA